jgi:hypothetical protein
MLNIIDDFEDEETLQEGLADLLKQGKLALITGAGFGWDFDLPMWNELVNMLYRSVKSKPISDFDVTENAEKFKIDHCNGDDEDFKNKVREILYKKLKFDIRKLSINTTINAIGALCMPSRRGSIKNIITYNFDELLELFFEYHGFSTNVIIEPVHWKKDADISIYHPHGFLPLPSSKKKMSKKITLDQESFAERDKEWKEELVCIMKSHFCIFIGISGKDDLMQEVFSDTKKKHIAYTGENLYWGVTLTTDNERKKLLEKCGIYLHKLRNYKTHLPDFLFGICQKAMNI